MRRMRIIDTWRSQVVVDGNRLLARLGVDREGVEDASPGLQRVLDDTRLVPLTPAFGPMRHRRAKRLFARGVVWVRGGRFLLRRAIVVRHKMSLCLNDVSFFVAPIGGGEDDWPRLSSVLQLQA